MSRGKSWLRIARSPEVIVIALRTAVVVGTLLNLINYGSALLVDWRAVPLLPIALNFCVPYCVATHGATSFAIKQMQRG